MPMLEDVVNLDHWGGAHQRIKRNQKHCQRVPGPHHLTMAGRVGVGLIRRLRLAAAAATKCKGQTFVPLHSLREGTWAVLSSCRVAFFPLSVELRSHPGKLEAHPGKYVAAVTSVARLA